MMEQARPWTRMVHAKVDADLDATQFRALVGYCDTLPRPLEILPDDPKGRDQAVRGKVLFGQIGCAGCHTPDMGGVSGVYSDFLLHRVVHTRTAASGYSEVPPLPLPDDYPQPDEWKTPALWGVADSAPYFHDGATPTLEAAIRRHKADAESVTRAFESLDSGDRAAIVGFLKTLKAPDRHQAGRGQAGRSAPPRDHRDEPLRTWRGVAGGWRIPLLFSFLATSHEPSASHGGARPALGIRPR